MTARVDKNPQVRLYPGKRVWAKPKTSAGIPTWVLAGKGYLPRMSVPMNESPFSLSSLDMLSSSLNSPDSIAPIGAASESPRAVAIRSVLICETQPITVEGIRALLAATPDLRVIGVCENLAVCRELIRKQSPDLVLLDKALGMQVILDWIQNLRLSEMDSRRLAGLPENPHAATKPIIWGVSITEAEALRFLQAGAKGILRKSTSPANMLNCLRTVAGGKNWMEDSVFREQPRDDRYPRSELTAREQQVMELVEHGLKNREIARELGIRPGTVKIHLKHIFEKTGVRGRYGLALTGLRQKGVLAVERKLEVALQG
jgi:two-component system, NarL family, nitrate/nitrite response regulator NarL